MKIDASPTPPQQSAKDAGLRYISDDQPGYRRRKHGRGFVYLAPDGQPIRNKDLKSRLDALSIPPAWTEVWICQQPNCHLQATGRDEKGRKQYLYHPEWDAIRNRTKFDRMPAFAAALPALRAQVDRDLRKRGLPRQKVLAIMVRLLEKTLIRIGNPEYVRQNKSFGLSTLENEHFEVNGATLTFSFTGKSGKQHAVEVRDPRLARQLAELHELPGQRLFQYRDEAGNLRTIDSEDVNDYIRAVTGEAFSAKDFRTWGATVLAAVELYGLGPAESPTEQKRKLTAAVRQAAAALGNTAAVTRDYYIHPEILSAYCDGRLFTAMQQAAQQDGKPATELDLGEIVVTRILAEITQTQKKLVK